MICAIVGDFPGWRENGLTKALIAQMDSFNNAVAFNESNLTITQLNEIQGILILSA
jgi:hypothetical protein